MITIRITSTSTLWSLGTIAALLLAPSIGQACAVCMGGADEDVRTAFILATAFLTVCPLLMVGGLVWWVRRAFRAAGEGEGEGEARDAISSHDSHTIDAALPATPAG
jgi:high-affinity Fe2+/Pb2+ permease